MFDITNNSWSGFVLIAMSILLVVSCESTSTTNATTATTSPPTQDPPNQDPPNQDPPNQDPPPQDPPPQDPPNQDPPPNNSIVSSINPGDYTTDTLAVSKDVYIDRSFTYTFIPDAYVGLTYIKTANDDKASSGSAFVSFEISTDVTVYVAYDNRITTLPTWLTGWVATGDSLQTTDSTFAVYKKDFTMGTVMLGGNEDSTGSMYTVIVSNGVCETCANDVTLTYNWQANTNEITGYKVYSGPTVDEAVNEVATTQNTNIEFNAGSELALHYGDSICFRVKAYNSAGLSGFSQGVCNVIQN